MALLVATSAEAQFQLPACPIGPNTTWTNCQGSAALPDGSKYTGEWRNNVFHGRGTHTLPNGQRYVGEFIDGKRDGRGVEYAANGNVVRSGIWSQGGLGRPPASSSPVAAPINPSAPAPKRAGSGSGFRIGPGLIITNHHVIDGCSLLRIDGNSSAKVIASDPIKDLALINLQNDNGAVATIRASRIQLNEPVSVAGYPLDGAFSGIAITNGTVSRLSGLRGDTGEVQISAPVQPGNSGGPLIDKSGNVIGVVRSKLDALKAAGAIGDIPQNVNFAITSNTLRGFLDAKSIDYREVLSEGELTGVQIGARASAFTVLVECQK